MLHNNNAKFSACANLKSCSCAVFLHLSEGRDGFDSAVVLSCLLYRKQNYNFSTTDRIEHCNLSPLCFLQNLLLFFHGKATLTNQLSEHPYIKPFFVVSSRIFICVRISTANVFPNSLNTSVTSKASYDSNCCFGLFIRLQL